MSSYLKTLRRVPDDVILAVATRDIEVTLWHSCVCGRLMREERIWRDGSDGVDEEHGYVASATACAKAFGGSSSEWDAIWHGCNTGNPNAYTAEVEEAFTVRVMEAAGVA